MDIVVVRHGSALNREEARRAGLLDRDRPLTEEGQSRMRKAARGLAKCVPEVSTIITSPFRRAVETATILRREFKTAKLSETDALLPEAPPEELAQLLADSTSYSAPILVGHEPHLSSWLSWCLTGDGASIVELGKGGAYMLSFETAPGPRLGRLRWLVTSTMLRRL